MTAHPRLALLALSLLAACSGGGGGAGGASGGSTGSPSSDPAYFTSPTVLGLGARTVNLSPGGTVTLSQAVQGSAPGDDIVLGAGTYTLSGNLRMTVSGAPNQWIALRGAAGSRPVIDLNNSGEFNIAASYILLENLDIINGSGNNLHIAPQSTSMSHVIVRNVNSRNVMTGPGAAIKINANNSAQASVSFITIEDCDVSMSAQNALIDGVSVTQAVVRRCDIHDNAQGSHGIFFKGGSKDILIEDNAIRGIRGNAALQLGGSTGAGLFNPLLPDWEGADQLARNNLIFDFDDSGCEVRGVQRGLIQHNTFVTSSSFAIYRMSRGNTNSGGSCEVDQISFRNNLVISLNSASPPQYARNDTSGQSLDFAPTLWAGSLRNSSSPGPAVPTFPQLADLSVASNAINTILSSPLASGSTSRASAIAAYSLINGSPAINAASPAAATSRDINGAARSPSMPSFGADEQP